MLLRGPSGSGKSDLALRCLSLDGRPPLFQPVSLVADDRVELTRDGDRLMASPPAGIAGKIEVRGVGLFDLPFIPRCDVVLIADLDAAGEIERFPDVPLRETLLGVAIPVLRMRPFEMSAPLKVLLAINKFGVAALP